MKEIDFLPEWYKSGRRRQVSYRTQYVALAGVFVLMVVWNLLAVRSVSKAAAGIREDSAGQAEVERASDQFARIKGEMAQLQKKAGTIGQIDSRIDVASTLAEMSFLIDEKVVLSKVELVSERFGDAQQREPGRGSVVRVASGRSSGKESLPLGEVRFRVVISGVASGASDVAELVCKLEDSPYFCNVTSSWRNREIQAGTGSSPKVLQASEFEIGCYLANYRQGAACSVRKTGKQSREK